MDTPLDFELFFKENYRLFYFYALHLIDDEEASKDIVSDAFEYACHNFQSLQVTNWKSFMFAFLRNKCVDYLRHKAVMNKYADFYLQLTQDVSYSDDGEQDFRLELIFSILPTLTPQTRLVLQECYINQKSYKEVADDLNISVSAVRKHIVKALKTIREGVAKKIQDRYPNRTHKTINKKQPNNDDNDNR